MAHTPEQQDFHEAAAAVAFAQTVRARHRRRTERGSASREADIENALLRLRAAMAPLRSAIGRMTYPNSGIPAETQQRIREASDALQRERRKMWKMQARRPA